MKRTSSLFCSALLLSLLPQLQADQVDTKDGSKIIGTITKVHKDKLEIETSFAGKLSIAMDKVKSFSTDEERQVEFGANKDKLSGKVNFNQGTTTIVRKDQQKIQSQRLLSLWKTDAKHPSWKKEITWKHKAFLDLTKRTGNTDSMKLNGGFVSEWNKDNDKVKLYGTYTQAENNDNEIANELVLGADYEHVFGKDLRHSWYGRLRWEKDEIEGIDTRFTTAVGYGYYMIKDETTSLRGRAGLAHRYEVYSVDDKNTTSEVGIDFGLALRHKMSWADWYTDVTYTPAMADFASYRLEHESGIEIPFNVQKDMKLSLNTGVNHQFNSEAADDRSELDTIYFLRLQLTF